MAKAKQQASKAPKASVATPSSAVTSPPPNWPAFKPPLPVVNLSPEALIEDKVVVFRNFFPQSLCRDYVSFLSSLPLTTTPGGKPKKGMAARQNDRFQIDDPAFARRLWLETGLQDALLEDEDLARLWGGEVLGLNPNIRVYRYSKGQYFAPHYDDSNTLALTSTSTSSASTSAPGGTADPAPIPAKTTWTLLLYLTGAADGACAGGETVFFTRDRPDDKEAVAVAPEAGMLLLHKHGDDCMLHEGREVTAGEKWVLRTDLAVRR